jgi:hypothetical protein
MFNHIYDAVRVSELESRSALPNAPVLPEDERVDRGWRFTIRLTMSGALHRLADALAPSPELADARFSPDPCSGC